MEHITVAQLNPSYYNIYNLYSIGLIAVYYFIVLNVDRLQNKYDVFTLKIFGFMLFAYYSLSLVPTFAVRLSEFLGSVLVVLLAHSTQIIKQKRIAILAVIVFSLLQFGNLVLKQQLLRF